jgi:hypothetical protein
MKNKLLGPLYLAVCAIFIFSFAAGSAIAAEKEKPILLKVPVAFSTNPPGLAYG